MKKVILAILFALIYQTSNACVIFIYHKVGDNRTPSTNVSIKRFKKQMEYLKANNYKVISLKRLVDLLKEKRKLPEKCVVLTFDDGYKSIFINAFPTIKKYGYPITVFLPTEAIEKHYPDYLTIKQIEEMRKYGVDFESHSYAHPRFTPPPKPMTEEEYKNWIRGDLTKSIEFFKKHFDYKPFAFAIPYGDYNKIIINIAKSLGFEAILTQDATALNKYTPLWLLPREPILGKNWSTMEHFKEVLNEGYIALNKREPDIGIAPKNPRIVGGVVKNFERFKKSSFRVYLSERGWQWAQIKGNFVFIKNNSPLKKKLERVGVMAITKHGKVSKTLWLIETVKPYTN